GPDPDGHTASRPRRIPGAAPDQGEPGASADPDHRRHVLCSERRGRKGPAGGLRRISLQAREPPRAAGPGTGLLALNVIRAPGASAFQEPMMRDAPQILIVDDNFANLDILRTRLANHGYDVITATDGEEALRVAREKLPDLILLDVMMPKMDGTEV